MNQVIFRPIVKQAGIFPNRRGPANENVSLFPHFRSNNLINSYGYANIKELENKYIIQVAIPGYSKEDIKIELMENKLQVSGNIPATNDVRYIKREFEVKSFERNFLLNDLMNQDQIEAQVNNGVLEIEIPKAEVKPAKVIDIM